MRITASAALGKAGLINIEREANMSGRLHDKGMQIIAGYLRSQFAQLLFATLGDGRLADQTAEDLLASGVDPFHSDRPPAADQDP